MSSVSNSFNLQPFPRSRQPLKPETINVRTEGATVVGARRSDDNEAIWSEASDVPSIGSSWTSLQQRLMGRDW
jgi:hypothetical protein